ncbi:unnamed protein product [Leptosia nina]|uniref:Uncharacterized protein n=1 Tax=Leptosia nina TaxID=320188 RepID=A0AAV1JVW4_9NEOP
MKSFILLSALVAFVAADSIEYYTTGNDYYDVDAMMKDSTSFKKFVDCYLDVGPCDALTASFKVNANEAIATACRRCNDAQKHLVNRTFWGLKNLHPEYYEKFQKKYDPDNIYFADFEKAVAGY